MDHLIRILNAKVYDVAVETSLATARLLSSRIGNTVLIKREDEQPVFSFKLRGAYNKMAHFQQHSWRKGGGGKQRKSRAGCRAGGTEAVTEATIVMPRTTPAIKIDAVQGARRKGSAARFLFDFMSTPRSW